MANDRVVVFPFLGEFGWLVMTHARYVHQLQAREKVVCVQKGLGLECLYPSATSFKLIENPIPDENRQNDGAHRYRHEYGEFCDQLHSELSREYPGHEIVRHPNYDCPWHWSDLIWFMPRADPILPAVDVVLGVRKRSFDATRNYEHWDAVAAVLRSVGLRVGLAGLPDTSEQVGTADVRSWDHPHGPTAGCVDLIAHCKVYAGVDSGVSHLAALMQAPMVVLPPRPGTTPDKTSVMHRANKRYCKVLASDSAWADPSAMIGSILLACREAYRPSFFYSDQGEDRWIAANLQLPADGVFVEVGAGDGVRGSNTYCFERAGWTGVVIEADSQQLPELRKHRRCGVELCAIRPTLGPPKEQGRPADGGGAGTQGCEGAAIIVPVKSLGDVLDDHGITRLDLLSINAAAAGLEVWTAFDVGRYKPKAVVIKWDAAGVPDRKAEIRLAIQRHGYEEAREVGRTLIFRLIEQM